MTIINHAEVFTEKWSSGVLEEWKAGLITAAEKIPLFSGRALEHKKIPHGHPAALSAISNANSIIKCSVICGMPLKNLVLQPRMKQTILLNPNSLAVV